MNYAEFQELKAGDRLDNYMSKSSGTVTEVAKEGVRVRWGDGTPGKDVTFLYTTFSTAWMHWTKAEEASDAN